MTENYTYADLLKAGEQPSEHVKRLLDLDLMHLAMATLDALNNIKIGIPTNVMRFHLEGLVKIATIALKDLDAETPKEQ